MRTIDTGTVAGDTGWSFRLVGFAITLGGIFIVSALIGVLASGLEGRLNDLRRGRSQVVETGHTVILGWSPQVFTIVSELAFANRQRRDDRGFFDGGTQRVRGDPRRQRQGGDGGGDPHEGARHDGHPRRLPERQPARPG